jgi:hypothetical protein
MPRAIQPHGVPLEEEAAGVGAGGGGGAGAVVVTVVVVVQRSGIFVSLNQQRHVALVKWRYPMYRRSW